MNVNVQCPTSSSTGNDMPTQTVKMSVKLYKKLLATSPQDTQCQLLYTKFNILEDIWVNHDASHGGKFV